MFLFSFKLLMVQACLFFLYQWQWRAEFVMVGLGRILDFAARFGLFMNVIADSYCWAQQYGMSLLIHTVEHNSMAALTIAF